MDITPMIPSNRQVIDGFGPGQFCISSQWRVGAVVVLPDHTEAWGATDAASLTLEDFAPVIAAEPKVEILLLGTGPTMKMIPKDLRKALREQGIVVEPMDSRAVCRTYNVLLAEGRRVAAAMLPV